MTVLLRILMSREAQARLEPGLKTLLAGRPYRLVAPDEDDADQAQVAFISRDITGLSTKHEVLPHTQQAYDAMLRSTTLQWVHVHSAGADRPVYVALRERGVEVTTSQGANAQVVAQSAVLGLLALARQWPKLLAAQRERRWAPLQGSGDLPRDLQGQTAMIVGWGPIGQEIGRLLLAIGLRLVVARRNAAAPEPNVEFIAPEALLERLPGADWLILACPLTSQTRGLIGVRELAALPRHAGLVNVSRGEVVLEAALIEALRLGRLNGAYLDVFEHEPLAAESPLWDLPNVIATPHSAGASGGNEERVDGMFLGRLNGWMWKSTG